MTIESPYTIEQPRETDAPPVPLAAPPRPTFDPVSRPTIPNPMIPLVGTVPLPASTSQRPAFRRRRR